MARTGRPVIAIVLTETENAFLQKLSGKVLKSAISAVRHETDKIIRMQSHGDSMDEALSTITETLEATMETLKTNDLPLPEPDAELKIFQCFLGTFIRNL